MNDLFWDNFTMTGSVDAYMSYRAYRELEDGAISADGAGDGAGYRERMAESARRQRNGEMRK